MPRPIHDAGTPGEPREAQAAREEEARRLAIARRAQAVARQATAAARPAPSGRPPLPPSAPLETPVSGLKRRTILESDLSPEAAELLHRTPTRVFSKGIPVNEYNPNIAGTYWGMSSPQAIDTTNSPNTLSHEFLHRWYDTELPPGLKAAWDVGWPKRMTSPARDILRYGVSLFGTDYRNPDEAFAYTGENGPEWMGGDTRNTYYDGVYRDRPHYPNPYSDLNSSLLRALQTPEMENTSDHTADRESWPENYQGGPYDVDWTRPPGAFNVAGRPGLEYNNPYDRPTVRQYPNQWERMIEELKMWRNRWGDALG